MPPTRRSPGNLAILLVLVAAGFGLWVLHARAWDLGQRSPVLNYDTAQYALAARELAEHGRLATRFALPLELATHARPPWPLAVVQPGLVVAEAVIFRLTPPIIRIGDLLTFYLQVPHQREWLTLLIPFACFLTLAALVALVAARILEKHAPSVSPPMRRMAALTLGLGVLLDPEAQHFAAGGFTELPFTLGLAGAFAALASERAASRRPLLFGLLLGVTGAFRANMLGFVPLFALGAALLAPERRLRAGLLVLLGFALPLAPWWFYKWRAFGSPAWDLTRLVVWEGVQGRSWFSLFHLPDPPLLPGGFEAVGLIAAKTARRLPGLLLTMLSGPRPVWIGAIVLWLVVARPPRPLAVAAACILGTLALSLVAAAASIPWIRYLYPARMAVEAAGPLALWGLVARAPVTLLGPAARRIVQVGIAALVLGWGAGQTARGNAEARATAAQRGVPSVLTLRDLAHRLRREVPQDEVVMSNLGPLLAWYARRPVLHLSLTPSDMAACRRRLEFRHVVLAFRDPEQAWEGWQEVVARPDEAPRNPEWNVTRERHWRQLDGFHIVWLELGPSESRYAAAPGGGSAARSPP